MGPVLRVVCALLLTGLATAYADPQPQQKIALTAKPSVVRVWGAYIATYKLGDTQIPECCAIGGSGTGFFITADGYIATNAHVVSDIFDGEDTAKSKLYTQVLQIVNKAFAERRYTQAQMREVYSALKLVDLDVRKYVVLPNGEKLEYEITRFGKPGSGRDAAIIKVKADNAPALPVGDSTRTQVADPIVVIGYPGVADMKALLDESSLLQATVTDGAVSSLKRAASGEQILQISAPITHGNSGGPALDMKGNVIGLATFGNESEIQGFNFLVASATLNQLVKDAKLELKPSQTLAQWQSGLEHYWRDEYSAAIENFRAVETLFPMHSEASSLIRMSNEAKKEGKEKKPPADNSGLVAGLVIGGIAVIGGVVMLKRRGKPASPLPPGGVPLQSPPQGVPSWQPPGAPQMYGRVQPAPMGHQPVAKTVAIQQGGIAPTAFAAMAIGSLWCTRGALQGQRFALNPTGIIIGRQPGVAHVLINDHRASGKHVWIGIDQGKLVAIDQGTTNGTYINDVTRGRITRQELRDGDIVIVSEPDCLSLQVRLG